MRNITDEIRIEHEKYQNNLEYFCRKALRIKFKEGGDGPFEWNKAQRYLHARIEDQKRRTGKVRMFILKGRQQGISTYIAARLYHKATRNSGHRVFILSHHSSTTDTLFQIVSTYHEFCPAPLKPEKILDNNRKLVFKNKSQYTVGTAGTGEIGRGDTNQYLHWSEVAFSDNIEKLLAGVCQTVADVDGTEKLYESTANGIGNFFYNGCMDALAGSDDYELVFIPWFWQEEYRAKPPADFELTDEEADLKKAHDLDDAQIQWRRNKISELQKAGFNGVQKFKQEYPCTPAEAFQSSGDQLVDPDAVTRAMNSGIKDPNAPLILGVDPGPVRDRTTIAWRRGRELIKVERFNKVSPMTLTGMLAQRIDRFDVAKCFVDIAEGRGVVDRAMELGYGSIVTGIPFNMSPSDSDRYVNKRAEMMGEFKEWIEDETGVSLPKDQELEVEIGMIPAWANTSNGKLQLISKKEIKKAYGRSTDLVDACMLTFAQPVSNRYNDSKRLHKTRRAAGSELSATRARRKQKPIEDDDDDFDGPRRAPRKRLGR